MKATFIKKHITNALVGLSVILGALGYIIYFHNYDISYDFTDLIYAVIKLFLVDSNFDLFHVNILLNIARFLAPFSLATAIIIGIMKLLSKTWNMEKVKHYNNHIIICGDAGSNQSLALDIQNKGDRKHIILRKENSNTESQWPMEVNYRNIDQDLIEQTAIYQASYIFISFENDAETLVFTKKLLDIIDFNSIEKELDIILMFRNPEWAEVSNDLGIMESINTLARANKNLNIRYLNYIDKSIRKQMLKYSPDNIKAITQKNDPQLCIGLIGDNTISKRLIINLALNAHYINHRPLKIYLSQQSSPDFDSFLKHYQILNILEIELRSIEELAQSHIDITAFYICQDDELELAKSSLILNKSPYQNRIRRFVFTESLRNLTALLPDTQNTIIDISKEIGVWNNIIDESLDDLAKTIHSDYIESLGDKRIADKPTHQDWDFLPDEIKDRNRMQADHMGVKIRSLGCVDVAKDSPIPAYDWNNDARLEDLSKAEHLRWNAYMYYKGWKVGPTKDERMKIHTDLVAYENLDEPTKDYDRNAIKNIPNLLDQLKRKVVQAPAHNSPNKQEAI